MLRLADRVRLDHKRVGVLAFPFAPVIMPGLEVLLLIRDGKRILRLGVVGGRGGGREADTESGEELEVDVEAFGGVTIARFFPADSVVSALSLRDRLPLATVAGFAVVASTTSSSLVLRFRPRFSFPVFSSALVTSSVALSARRLCRRRGVVLKIVNETRQ